MEDSHPNSGPSVGVTYYPPRTKLAPLESVDWKGFRSALSAILAASSTSPPLLTLPILRIKSDEPVPGPWTLVGHTDPYDMILERFLWIQKHIPTRIMHHSAARIWRGAFRSRQCDFLSYFEDLADVSVKWNEERRRTNPPWNQLKHSSPTPLTTGVRDIDELIRDLNREHEELVAWVSALVSYEGQRSFLLEKLQPEVPLNSASKVVVKQGVAMA